MSRPSGGFFTTGCSGAENGIGRLTTVIDGAGETTFDYTASGELKREERTTNGDTYSLAYTYDGAGQIETITYPSGRVVTYERDAAGEVATVTTTAPDGTETVLASQVEHAPFGPITSLQHGNGLVETRDLNEAYQVASVTVPGVLAREYTYTVDASVAGIDDLLSSARTQAFGYDPIDRLTAADGVYGNLGFEYDANANRKALIEDGQRDDYRLDTSSNWLLEAGTRDYRYDNAGNIEERGEDAFAYDTHHRLTEATVDGITATHAYNVQHQRVSKTVGGTTTQFFYGQGGELLSERVVGTGLTAAEYVWLDGKPLAYITNGQVYQVHTDHLGTPQVLTDASGTAAWEAEYRPFGEAVTTGNLSYPLRFPGQYHDTETGLHYNWHRYYDPATGRYLTSDPIGLGGGLNPYLYAEANPLLRSDPAGLCPWCVFGAVVGGGLNLVAQYHSGEPFDPASFVASTVSGAAGGGLGTLTRGLGWGTNILANSVGSGVIGGSVTAAKNEITGSCDDVIGNSLRSAMFGGLAAGTGSSLSGLGAAVPKIQARRWWVSASVQERLAAASNAITPSGKQPFITVVLVTSGNIASNVIGNLSQ